MSADPCVIVESEELVSPETFALIQERYWVLAWRREYTPPYWWDWVFALSEPRPVPNPQMYWRRPTYQEATVRQWWFENDRSHWNDCIERYGGKLQRYCVRPPLPSVNGGSTSETIKAADGNAPSEQS